MTGEDELLHDTISSLLAPGGQGGAAVDLQADLRPYPLTIVPALRSCRRVIYTTKIDWLVRLADGADFPEDVAVLWRSVPLIAPHRALLRGVVQSLGAPMYFVGDLDPLDLATYATLAEPGESPLATASYLGVSDAWIERCERDLALRPGKSIDTACIRMESDERDGLVRLRQVPIDWESLVGPRGLSMLEAGMKLELEGASSPDFYSSSFRTDLLRFIFG